MQNKFRNPALELMEKQERILRAYNNPALETRNYISNLHSQTDRIYEIERMAQKMCMPQAAINAMDAYTKTISADGIKKLLETIQKPLTNVSVRLSMLDRLDYSYLTHPAIHNINAMTATMSDTMSLLAETLSVYNTTAFTDSLYSSAMVIDSVLIDSFGYLHSIIKYFPDEAEQAFSENPLDMFSEELIFEEEKDTFIEKVKEALSSLTLYQKINVLFTLISFLMTLLSATNMSISAGYSNHTEKIIVGNTIQETSDTDFNFDLTFEDQDIPQNEELISCIEELYQQLETLTEMVSELEKQEILDCYQCECCDNS